MFFFFSSRRRHTRWPRDWSSDVCSSDLPAIQKTAMTSPWRASELRIASPLGLELRRLFLPAPVIAQGSRSEERRVGKECRKRGPTDHEKKKEISNTSRETKHNRAYYGTR